MDLISAKLRRFKEQAFLPKMLVATYKLGGLDVFLSSLEL